MTPPAEWIRMPVAVLADRGLTPSTKLLYAVILDHIGGNGRAWPGTRLLSRETGLCRRTVLASVAQLESCGLLVVERRRNGQGQQYRRAGTTGDKTTPVQKTHRCRKLTGAESARTGAKTAPEAVQKSHQNQKTKNQTKGRRRGAAPKRHTKTSTGDGENAALGRLTAELAEHHRDRPSPKPALDPGPWIGVFRKLLRAGNPEAQVALSLGRWFQRPKPRWSATAFHAAFQDRDADLWGPGGESEPTDEQRAIALGAAE